MRKKNDLYYWEGYGKNSGRYKESLGLGRCLSKNLVERLDYSLWLNDLNKGLDGSMERKISKLENVKKINFTSKKYGFACDIKTGNNITKLESFVKQLTKVGTYDKTFKEIKDLITIDGINKLTSIKNEGSLSNYEFTIIIPTYNTPEYLHECLKSILESVKNLKCEILIGIDGCKKTLGLVKGEVFDERIRFFYFKDNVGPYIIKNSLSNISSSGYLIFFDSDDIMKEEFIQFVINEKPKYSLLKPKYLDFTDKINPIIKTSRTYGEGVFAINKKLFLEFNGFEGWKCAADSELMGRLYKNKVKLTHSKEICFYRRKHPESLTMHHETGMKSKMRHEYTQLMKTKKKFGPLPFLIKSEFEEVSLIKDDKSELKEFELIKVKNENLIKEINLNPSKKKCSWG